MAFLRCVPVGESPERGEPVATVSETRRRSFEVLNRVPSESLRFTCPLGSFSVVTDEDSQRRTEETRSGRKRWKSEGVPLKSPCKTFN